MQEAIRTAEQHDILKWHIRKCRSGLEERFGLAAVQVCYCCMTHAEFHYSTCPTVLCMLMHLHVVRGKHCIKCRFHASKFVLVWYELKHMQYIAMISEPCTCAKHASMLRCCNLWCMNRYRLEQNMQSAFRSRSASLSRSKSWSTRCHLSVLKITWILRV